MPVKLRRLVSAIVVALTLMIPGRASAQGAPFERLEVSLWPEYDRPAVLVIYRVTLPASFPLPGTVRVRIPASAGQPNAVAEAEPSGNLVMAPYERAIDGDWAVLTISARSARLQVEYYDELQRDGSARSYRFEWPGDHAVSSFLVDVQEPADTVNMRTVPPSPGGMPGVDGLMHHNLDLGAVAAGEERVINLDYTRGSDALSADLAAPPPPRPVPEAAADGSDDDAAAGWYRIAIGMLAAGLAGAVAYWLLFLRGRAGSSPRGQGGAGARPKTGKVRGGARFCTSCGSPVDAGDRFCHSCGGKLQRP